MKELIISIFGEYEPITYEAISYYSAYSSSGDVTLEEVKNTVIPAGLAGCDWTYILGVIAFLIVLYCILRIIGGVISRV